MKQTGIIVFSLLLTIIAFAQKKCNCPPVKIAVNDFDHRKLTPSWYNGSYVEGVTKLTKQQEWEFHRWLVSPSSGAEGFIKGATMDYYEGETLFHSDNQFVKTNQVPSITPGIKKPDADFEVSGKYEKVGNNIVTTVYLKDLKTNAQVAEASEKITYSQYWEGDLEIAADRAAQKLLSTLHNLCNYKHDKVNWHITVTYTGRDTIISSSAEARSRQVTNAEVLLDICVLADAPENGYIILNSDFYQIINANITGVYNQNYESASKYEDGMEYRKGQTAGTPDDKNVGFQFEYDPAPDGTAKLFQTFIRYNIKHISDIKRTATFDHREWLDTTTQDDGAEINIGGVNDKIQVIKNGFIIDGGELINKEEDELQHGHTTEKGYRKYHITIMRQ